MIGLPWFFDAPDESKWTTEDIVEIVWQTIKDLGEADLHQLTHLYDEEVT